MLFDDFGRLQILENQSPSLRLMFCSDPSAESYAIVDGFGKFYICYDNSEVTYYFTSKRLNFVDPIQLFNALICYKRLNDCQPTTSILVADQPNTHFKMFSMGHTFCSEILVDRLVNRKPSVVFNDIFLNKTRTGRTKR